MATQIIDRTRTGNVIEDTHFNEHTGEMWIERYQDVEPVLDLNQARANDFQGYARGDMTGVGTLVAEIPAIVADKWKAEYGVDVFNPNDHLKVAMLLNSLDYQKLRSIPGRI